MKILDDAIHAAIKNLPVQVTGSRLREKLAAEGIKISEAESERLAREIIENDSESFQLSWRHFWRRQKRFEFTDADAAAIMKKLDKFSESGLSDFLTDITDNTTNEFLDDLRKRWKREQRSQEKQNLSFQKRLKARWGSPLSTLKMMLTICREVGQTVSNELRTTIGVQSPHLVDVVSRLHARACQVTDEIITLLEGGFADGAMARWRTLHEIAVITLLISEHGEEIAERYSLHQHVESWRAARDYRRCQDRLGYDPITDAEFELIEKKLDELTGKYGQTFVDDLGWAAPFVSSTGRVGFSHLQAAINVDHLKAHYRMAGHNVHGNPKGAFFKLGIIGERPLLLAGPSNAGLADPMDQAALSLLHATSVFAKLQPRADNIVVVKLLVKLVDEIGKGAIGAHIQLEKDERALRVSAALSI